MKVVMIGPFGLRPKGTVSVRALPMAQALARRGHDVTLLVPSWDWPEDAGRTWNADGVRVECLSLPANIPLFFYLVLALRLVRRAVALNPEVIHLFKPKAYPGLAHWILVARRRLGRRVPRLVLDTDDWEAAWNPVAGYPHWQRLFFTWQERWGLRHADAVTVASLKLRELVLEVGVPHERIFYLPNGVRPATASALRNSPAGDSSQASSQAGNEVRLRHSLDQYPLVLLYTRFAEFELSRLVDLIKGLAQQINTARWLVVGEGLYGEEKRLASQLRALGLDQFVVFAGWVPSQELPHYFAAADVAAYPFDDTPINQARCSVKLLDLLGAGVPVVTNSVGQNKTYVLGGETGLLIPPGDTAAFVAALAHLLSDETLRRRLGTAAQGRMLEHFTWSSLVEAAEHAYR
jgi:glycosyltransferase involved in cell wall biosynthesis